MQTTILGRTGLCVSIAGLGCGGYSRLGLESRGPEHAAAIVRAAYDEGITFFDTAPLYGTQGVVGAGLLGIPRDSYVLSTKVRYKDQTPADLERSLEKSLGELRTDHVDILHLHGVTPEDYPMARETLVPAMRKAQRAGKVRFLGITENFASDTSHAMYALLLPEALFDVIMIGYNLLNQSAARTLLPLAREKNIGVLCMYAVRSALANPLQLRLVVDKILASGQADPALVAREGTLDFLLRDGIADSVMEAAYRFCRHTVGIDVVLTGTGSLGHLRENLASIQGPRLPDAILERLQAMFGKVDCVSGQNEKPYKD